MPPSNVPFPPVEIDPFYARDLQQMAVATNYLHWQFEMVAPYLTGRVLEIGGGIGNFTPALAQHAEHVITIEPNTHCYRQLVEATKELRNVEAYNVTAEELHQTLDPSRRVDAVVCMNVLEHIEDDHAALSMFMRRLTDEGTLVLLVPAVPWVYGSIDRRLGHYRRYSKRMVRALIASAEMQLVRLRYFNLIGLCGWLWNITISKREQQSDLQIRFFDRYIVPWQSFVESVVPPPIGQSLLLVARKVSTTHRGAVQ